ncbi:MAG TPA: uroporphyrinogen-III synthase [Ktedonobacteraceae bacterium]|jgi:uroporphyrinogen-III synthase|nr:uroporphyrinogen-III synthase [Ktedonobacteraceae bacterium]
MSESAVKALPLRNKRILVTRTREQAGTFSALLRSLGALPVEFPTIRIIPPADWAPLDHALRRLCANGYDWLVLTSANGVTICFERLRELGYTAQDMGSTHIAAIGPATAAALSQYGIAASIVPGEYVAESVVAALIDDAYQTGKSLQGQRILLARAAEARKVLVTGLQQAGAIVDEVAAYFTVSAAAGDERGLEVVRLLRNRQLDIITFTSSSTVRNFMQWLQQCEPGFTNEFSDLVRQARPKIACIGPITSQTAREFDLDVHIEAQEFTINGLVKAIIQDEETIWQIQQS